MEAGRPIEFLTVYNKPFFVNELLRIIRPSSISREMFADLVDESKPHDINTILTAMTRQIDRSGVVPNLAGVCEDPQAVFEYLVNLGHAQLLKVARFDPEMQMEIFDTLRGNQGMTLRALLVLDELQGDVIRQLLQARQQSPLALALRQANEEALKELYKRPQDLHSPLFDKVISLEDRRMIFTGEPRICYPAKIHDGRVAEVWQFLFVPRVAQVRLPAPYEKHKVGEILDRFTPNMYRRDYMDDAQYDPRTPAGFIGLLGKVGGALPRLIAAQVKKDEQLREQVMREEEFAAALYELLSR